MDAAYRFDASLWSLASTSNYDFARHDSDWTDAQQLYYLCTPDMHMVTSDQRLITRVTGSIQAARILSYESLRQRALAVKRSGTAGQEVRL